MAKTYSTEKEKQKCVLITICSKKSDNRTRKEEELKRLAFSAGLETAGCYFQNIKEFNKATVLGSGKLIEIKREIDMLSPRPEVAIVDYALTGSQIKNISDALELRVVDRVGLIIDIFALGAKSREAKLQVKFAQNKYLLPRLNEIAGTSGRYGGAGVGMRGPGERKLELSKRAIMREMETIRKELSQIKNGRNVTRRSRNNSGVKKIAIVGYTNAGKSSLLNLLTKDNIYADDKLFATLDTTSRKLFIDGQNYVITDTVGFISDLPHELVEAFSSTLEEAAGCDLILHVVDCSAQTLIDGVKEYQKNIDVTNEVLDSIGATQNRLIVFNKCDLITKPFVLGEGQVLVSTKTGRGISVLLQQIKDRLN